MPALQLAGSGEDARLLRVAIGEDGQHGALVLDEAGVQGVRSAEAASCSEVAEILAFAVALAIDPSVQPPPEIAARLEPSNPTTDGHAPPPPSPARALPPPAPEADVVVAPSSRRATAVPHSFHWAFDFHGAAASALAPHTTLGGGAALQSFVALFGAERMLRLGLDYSTSAPANVDGASVRFGNWLGLFEACPRLWRHGASMLDACLRIDAGVRTVRASNIPGGHEEERPWLSLGPALHGRFRFWGPAFVDGGVALAFTAVRDRVFLAPDSTVHRAPAAGVLAELSIGCEFGDRNGS